jgi:hypothetical protein
MTIFGGEFEFEFFRLLDSYHATLFLFWTLPGIIKLYGRELFLICKDDTPIRYC